jgi:Carboxypeptidase regulatory-like domain/TonB dependent receptor
MWRPHRFAMWLLCLSFFPVIVLAQRGTGTVTGIVTDLTGGAVIGATVEVRSIATNAERQTVSTSSGLYSIPGLLPGTYTVSVEAPGFAPYDQAVQIAVDAIVSVDVHLKVGQEIRSMEVAAESGAEPETQTQTLSEVVDSRQITELPTLTRDPYDLVGIAGNISADPSGRGVGVAINGQRSASTDITLDGGENVDLFLAGVGQGIPLDAVQEFRVVETNYTAESGRASGGIVDVATQQGTNSFHGTVYEFNRISALAANIFDNNAKGLARGHFTRNQFGYAVGGPIKRGKLFFFQSTEWTRVRSTALQNVFVATQQFIGAAAPETQAYFNAFGALRTPINGPVLTQADMVNALGASNINPVGPFAALPSTTPVFGQVVFPASSDVGGGQPQNSYSLVGREDYNVSRNTRVYGRYALASGDLFPGTTSSSPYVGYDMGMTTFSQNLLLSMTHVFSPHLVSQSKIVFNRLNSLQLLGTAPSSPALFLNVPIGNSGVTAPGYQTQEFGGPQNVLQFHQDVGFTRGRHTFRFGGLFINVQDNRFSGFFREGTEIMGTDPGSALDQFLAGQLFSFLTAVDPQRKFPCIADATGTLIVTPQCTLVPPLQEPRFSRNNRFHDAAAYAQDSWRIHPRLVLNVGVRWEYYGIQHNTDPNLDSNFYYGPGANAFEQIRHGQVLTTPHSPIGGFSKPRYGDFAPRIGLAWDVFGDGKTSLRGGYGIGYERNFGLVTFNAFLNPPNFGVVALINGVNVPSLPVTTDNLGLLSSSSSASVALPPLSLRNLDQNLRTAFAHFWSVSLEREIARQTVLSIAYSGSRGVHLYTITNLNRPGSGVVYLGDDPALNPFSTLNLQYQAINTRGNQGFSWYHALNVRVRSANFANTGLSLTTNYTWSHTIDNLSSTFSESVNNFNLGLLDPFDPGLDRGNADFDVRHRFVLSTIWESRFFETSNKPVIRRVLGGWSLAGIFTAQTGPPFTIWDCSNPHVAICPRYIPGGPVSTSKQDAVPTGQPNFYRYLPLAPALSYVNPVIGIADFGDCSLVAAPPCPYPSGMTGRNMFRGPGSWNLDLGIYKKLNVSDKVSLQFRGELFDTFNHANMEVLTGAADVAANPFFIAASKGGNRNVQLALKLIF